jgi:excisionase family DNA binding protein
VSCGNGSAYLTVRAVAGRLAVSPKLVYRLIDAGKLQALRLGGILRVHEMHLAEFIAANETRAAKPLRAPRPAVKTPARKRQTAAPATEGFRFFPRRSPSPQ